MTAIDSSSIKKCFKVSHNFKVIGNSKVDHTISSYFGTDFAADKEPNINIILLSSSSFEVYLVYIDWVIDNWLIVHKVI